jgi:hypothetical protein
MKPVRSALLFIISVVLFSACFNPPEYSNVPFIEYEGIFFGKSPRGDDSLVVSISFKDGDGDMGLSQTNEEDINDPYHDINFFANDNGQLYPLASGFIQSFTGYTLGKSKKTPQNSFYQVLAPAKQVGELITLQSRNEGFSLPPFVDPYKCALSDESYLNNNGLPDTVYIYKDYKYLIKDHLTIVDSLIRDSNPDQYWFAVVDYFYIKPNPGHYNMYVKFLVKNNDGSFSEYNFPHEGFCESFNGRFPVLTDGKRPLEGVINYSMVSTGFLATFSIKTLKLQVTIYDKALNKSNTIETPEFRLEEI